MHRLFTGQSLARYADSHLVAPKVNFEVRKIPCSVEHIRETNAFAIPDP